jgi:hypothetical protein
MNINIIKNEELDIFINNIKNIIYIYNNNVIMIKNDLINFIDSFNNKNILIELLNTKIKIGMKENGILKIFKINCSFEIKLEILKLFEKYIYFNKIDLVDIAVSSVCGNINNNIKEYIILMMNKDNFIIEI